MLFYTPAFLVFAVGLLVVLALTPTLSGTERAQVSRKSVLLVASYIFYMWWNPAFIALILLSTAIDWLIGSRLAGSDDDRVRRRWLVASVLANLGLLATFKYADFFQSNLLWMLKLGGYEPGWVALNVTLPVGISFFTFQTMSYTIDLYRREIEPAKTPLDFALYVAFFPQLVAGPIVRAREFLPQLDQPLKLFFDRATAMLIVRGLAKKVLIADNLAPLVDTVFRSPGEYPSVVIWVAAICFAIQIYCDFSGYSDIAIGVARVLGFQLPENFRRPYFARSPSEFWQRWHISLSSWLRDYLYIPLGGNRGGTLFTTRNLMLTMLLGGLWHGASWSFVLWGAMHGLFLVVHRAYRALRFRFFQERRFLPVVVGDQLARVSLFFFVLLAWIPFRVTDFADAELAMRKFLVFDGQLSISGLGLGRLSPFTVFVIALVFGVVHIVSEWRGGLDTFLARAPRPLYLAALVVVGALFVLFWPLKQAPFIYFQF